MHYAEFDGEESQALLAAIKDYDAQKWKIIGQKLGKPAKVCCSVTLAFEYMTSFPNTLETNSLSIKTGL